MELLAQQVHQFSPTFLRAVDDRDVTHARQTQFHSDGPCGATGAEQHHRFALGIDHRLQGLEETLPVGVFTNEAALPPHHTVHRPHHRCGLAQTIEMVNDTDLVREAAIEAPETHGPGPLHGGTEVRGRDLHVDVAPVQPVVPEGRLHHRHRGIAVGPLGHGSDEFVQEMMGLAHGSMDGSGSVEGGVFLGVGLPIEASGNEHLRR